MYRREVIDVISKEEEMEKIKNEILNCKKCPLHLSRTNAVPGEGSINSFIMFIGEAPGRNEDVEGRPFVGAAGKLLTSLLEDIGLDRKEVYITNVVKCRPPNNRDPTQLEIKTCSPYLDRQILLIRPKIIVTLGRHSTKYLLEKNGITFKSILRIHGASFNLRLDTFNFLMIPTLHPAAALYNPKLINILKNDFDKIKNKLEEITGRREKVGLEKFF